MGSNKGQQSNNRKLPDMIVRDIRKMKKIGMKAPAIVRLFEGHGILIKKHHVWNINKYYQDVK